MIASRAMLATPWTVGFDQDIAAWHYRHYGPGEIVEINSIDVQIDIADVYQGLDFAEAEPGEE
jgi:hypothetical protein